MTEEPSPFPVASDSQATNGAPAVEGSKTTPYIPPRIDDHLYQTMIPDLIALPKGKIGCLLILQFLVLTILCRVSGY